LMVAEGGTSFNHAVTIAASDNITGPYVANERNPILTSRQLSYNNWVHSTGHGDLVELLDGRFYMFCLGVRGDVMHPSGKHRGSNMGRETHLVPVIWERVPFPWEEAILWPVVAPETGRVERTNPVPFQGSSQAPETAFFDNFDTGTLSLEWNFRRVPKPNTYSLTARKGFLRLFAQPQVISERVSASWMGVRQRESDFTYETLMDWSPSCDGAEAGIFFLQADNNYIKCTVVYTQDSWLMRLVLAVPSKPGDGKSPATLTVVKEQKMNGFKGGQIKFQATSSKEKYSFAYTTANEVKHFMTPFAETDANSILSMGGFQGGYTGAFLGLYCSSNGQQATDYADFDWVRHTPCPRS